METSTYLKSWLSTETEYEEMFENLFKLAKLTLVLDWTCSLQIKHFFTLGEHNEHVAICPQGPNSVSLFISEQTMHSSKESWSMAGELFSRDCWLSQDKMLIWINISGQMHLWTFIWVTRPRKRRINVMDNYFCQDNFTFSSFFLLAHFWVQLTKPSF